jgi:hypothetical protein
MTNDYTPFEDIHDLLMLLIVEKFPDLEPQNPDGSDFHVDIELPDDIEAHADPVFMLLDRIGGQAEQFTDYPIVDIGFYAPSWSAARDWARNVTAMLQSTPHILQVGERKIVLERTEVPSAPVELPWNDSESRRFQGTYRFSVRRGYLP